MRPRTPRPRQGTALVLTLAAIGATEVPAAGFVKRDALVVSRDRHLPPGLEMEVASARTRVGECLLQTACVEEDRQIGGLAINDAHIHRNAISTDECRFFQLNVNTNMAIAKTAGSVQAQPLISPHPIFCDAVG